jgi:hypothetical protein
MGRHDARCVGTVAAGSAALIWDASAPIFIFDRPFLVTPRWPLFSWRECYLAGKNATLDIVLLIRASAGRSHASGIGRGGARA